MRAMFCDGIAALFPMKPLGRHLFCFSVGPVRVSNYLFSFYYNFKEHHSQHSLLTFQIQVRRQSSFGFSVVDSYSFNWTLGYRRREGNKRTGAIN
jgi:hypothetical protein